MGAVNSQLGGMLAIGAYADMTEDAFAQFGLFVVYAAVGGLMLLTERVERSRALRIWASTFFLFAIDALLTSLRLKFGLPVFTQSISWIALTAAAIVGVAGTITFLGRALPRGLFILGGFGLVVTVGGLVLGVDPKVVRALVFLCIGVSFLWSAKLAFDVGIPKGVGRWVIGTAFTGAGLYAMAWPVLCHVTGFARFEFFMDFSLVMWGAAGALLVHFERSRQRMEQMVAQQLELRGQLERSERMEALGRLAGGVAHDFNNVLMTVIHGSELALRQLEDCPKAACHVESVLEAARGAAGFTRQLLALGRRRLPGRKPIRIDAAIRGALGMIRPMLQPNHKLIGPQADDSLAVLAGEGQLEQVIVNLSLNALDAMPQGGNLELKVETHQDFLRLIVQDTGHGMDDDTVKRVFEPFFSTKDSRVGSGLGLAAVYAIIRQLEGRVDVKSTRGTGTCFTIELPRCEPPLTAKVVPIRPTRPPSTVRILLVDDQESVLLSLSAGLASSGYQVATASSASDAIQRLCEKPPTLLLTDIRMPGTSGLELVAQVRKTHPSLPVIMMTGHANDEELESGKYGAQLLLKPFTIDKLQKAINSALAS